MSTTSQPSDRRPSRVQVLTRPTRTAPCCGHRTQDPLCCVIDPRGHADGRKRLPGDWCLWCGDPVVEGRSYCGPACSYAYHDDVALDF